ncbi:cell wall-active antibiotics response protein LiaF [Salipaludibacillus sp. CUR1]|uniref:cell wall-active antibiotics response protein LiaF n=1 Tax=Salipaludibacillus sp. CUR1 TaxID=2820003 RepID=UPI001E599DAB|nr:cell wall-active antibiotics response protein LiaF [Salipaludibacillus sp. CUR1]MCE7794881.1 cell wall-active antibiotics response protein LiaF [Salipaludibacillus sp. CUR1]
MKNFIGILILSTGIVFLLANTGFIDTEVTSLFSTFWPAIIVLFGLKILFEGLVYFFHGLRRDRWHIGKIIWGLIVTAAGAVLLGNNAGWFSYGLGDLWSWIWPLLIVYIGFKVLFDRDGNVVINLGPDDIEKVKREKRKGKNKDRSADFNFGPFSGTVGRPGQDRKTHRTFIGDISLGKQPWEPDGMDINMGIGSIELDLTKAILKEGDNIIDVSSWIGSVEIYVPKEMAVKAGVYVKVGEVTLFDDSHGGTGRNATYTSPGFHESEKRLILNVDLSIGDVEVLTVD